MATPYRDRIQHRLTEGLAPVSLWVVDDSQRHAGHGPRRAALAARGQSHLLPPEADATETHFRVEVVSPAFEGRSRVERHRMVTDLLEDELRERVHALSITARTPDEAEQDQATTNRPC